VQALFHAGATYEGDIFTIYAEHLEDAERDLIEQAKKADDEDKKRYFIEALLSIEFIREDMGDDTEVEYLCF